MKVFSQLFNNFLRNGLRNSKYRWLIVLASVFYLVSPLDVVPDALPLLGWIDDGVLVSLVLTEVSQYLLDRRKTMKDKSNEPIGTEA